MALFGKDKRKKKRIHVAASVVFTVQSGKDPKRVSSPVTGIVKDLSPKGMSVATPLIAPDGIHVMYDTLMIHQNSINATIFLEGKAPVQVTGTVAWFRNGEDRQGSFIFGMRFNDEAAVEELFLPDEGTSSTR